MKKEGDHDSFENSTSIKSWGPWVPPYQFMLLSIRGVGGFAILAALLLLASCILVLLLHAWTWVNPKFQLTSISVDGEPTSVIGMLWQLLLNSALIGTIGFFLIRLSQKKWFQHWLAAISRDTAFTEEGQGG